MIKYKTLSSLKVCTATKLRVERFAMIELRTGEQVFLHTFYLLVCIRQNGQYAFSGFARHLKSIVFAIVLAPLANLSIGNYQEFHCFHYCVCPLSKMASRTRKRRIFPCQRVLFQSKSCQLLNKRNLFVCTAAKEDLISVRLWQRKGGI